MGRRQQKFFFIIIGSLCKLPDIDVKNSIIISLRENKKEDNVYTQYLQGSPCMMKENVFLTGWLWPVLSEHLYFQFGLPCFFPIMRGTRQQTTATIKNNNFRTTTNIPFLSNIIPVFCF